MKTVSSLNMRVQLGIFQHRSEIRSTVSNVTILCRSSLSELSTNVTVRHCNVIADLVADGWDDARHRVFEVHHDIVVHCGSISCRTRIISIEHCSVIVSMRVAIHANVVAAQVFDMLSHYALELSLN